MIFLFDADCGFCTACVRRARRLFPAVTFRASHEVELAAYGLHQEDVQQRAYLIAGDSIVGGGQAITGLLASKGRIGQAAASVCRREPLRIPIEAIYRIVARNRHKLPGGTGSCALNR